MISVMRLEARVCGMMIIVWGGWQTPSVRAGEPILTGRTGITTHA